jgi:hypothetical protein
MSFNVGGATDSQNICTQRLRINGDGGVVISAPVSFNLGNLPNSSYAFGCNSTNNGIVIYVRCPDGVLRSATIGIA